MDYKTVHELISRIQNDSELIEISCRAIYNEFVDEIILGVIFEVHRAAKLGLDFLDKTDVEDESKYQIFEEIGLDVFGQAPTKKQLECVCPNCRRSLAASRFAPHLEKCMGMGRNSSRIASRRIANNSTPTYVTGGSEEDDDDNWSFNSEKRGNKRRRDKNSPRKSKVPKIRNGERSNGIGLNNDEIISNFELLDIEHKRVILQQICGVVSEHTGKRCTRSIRCPQHSEDQRQMVRLAVLEEVPSLDTVYTAELQTVDPLNAYVSVIPCGPFRKEKLKITVKKTCKS